MTHKAPDYLEDDPWFGPAILPEKQRALRVANSKAVAEKMLNASTKEVDNIHEVMYNMATRNGKTTTQLSSGGWTSGTGLNQIF